MTDRVSFEVAPAAAYRGGDYDLVTVFDCLHDMGDPIGAARHVRSTLKPDGTWAIVEPNAGDRLFALTDLHSSKVRRVRRDPRALVASCRVDGKLRSEPVPACAEVLTATADLERVQKLLLERYKVSYRVVMLIYRLGPGLRGQRGIADGAALAITVD